MASSTAAFDVLLTELSDIASQNTLERISRSLQAESLKLVADCFKNQCDPYGVPWAPIKRRGKILQDTGRLRASFAPGAVGPTGFSIGSNVEYAATQQFGAVYPARSNVNQRTLWQHPITGRIVSPKTKLAMVIETKFNATHGERKLTARPMVPDERGMPSSWRDAFAKVAAQALKGK
jgi:phage gpG-like protein